jgi:hypothetical protein
VKEIVMNEQLKRELELHLTRRQLFGLGAKGIGLAALASLLKLDGFAAEDRDAEDWRPWWACRTSRRR